MSRLLFCVLAAVSVGTMPSPAEASLVYEFTAGDGSFACGWETADEPGIDAWLLSALLQAADSSRPLSLDHADGFQDSFDVLDGDVLEYSLNGDEFRGPTPDGGYPAEPLGDGGDALGFTDGWSQRRFRPAWIVTVNPSAPSAL